MAGKVSLRFEVHGFLKVLLSLRLFRLSFLSNLSTRSDQIFQGSRTQTYTLWGFPKVLQLQKPPKFHVDFSLSGFPWRSL